MLLEAEKIMDNAMQFREQTKIIYPGCLGEVDMTEKHQWMYIDRMGGELREQTSYICSQIEALPVEEVMNL